ncbi:MAG: type II CRISPR RNA-guided endonuclease Cas9 [Magnetospirillum sp.]|nr:type II CRISPR RNA-guided endonuclease Cas9 [Magnetospirillum sp.]
MRVLGLDVGIASVGWALLEFANEPEQEAGRIVALGTWMFDAPEEKGSTGTKLKSAMRRTFRAQRRVVARRAQRMSQIRALFHQSGLTAGRQRDALAGTPNHNPWALRIEALRRRLTPHELAVALGHIARHRGFKSNSKGGKAQNASDTGKMLKASADLQERLARYRTPAQLLLEDEGFIVGQTPRKDGTEEIVRRLRNRDGDYSRSLLRDDLEAEVRLIFREQRRLGQKLADQELERRFIEIAFFQRPLQDSETLLGDCPFERGERRTAKRSRSFELFRLLSRLNALTVIEGRKPRRLTPEETALVERDFGTTAKISFTTLRKRLGLSDGAHFDGIKADEESARDIVARSGGAADGTYRLRKLIIDRHGALAWASLLDRPAALDRIAEVLTFREDIGRIREGLAETGLDPAIVETLVEAAERDELKAFTGAGHISAKAARAMIPGLRLGLTYDKAAAEAGYDHTQSREGNAFDVGVTGKAALGKILSEERISPALVGSPTARKALIEAVKQVKAICERHGEPDYIHIELARDVGKSIEERGEIERGIEKRNKVKDKLREWFEADLGRPPQGPEELLRYELWREQQCKCVYTGDAIHPTQILAQDNSIQVDHILPWSRFGDDGFTNKCLCTAKANQDKKARTPFEWFTEDKTEAEWETFSARVRALPDLKGFKRRNYMLRDAAAVQDKFRDRNLNDTRWTCRLLAEALKRVYPTDDGKRRVCARPGPLTDKLRRAWGLQWIKKTDGGKRIPDDRHHALDAVIVAATSESMLNRLTRQIQRLEAQGSPYDLKDVPNPWPHFREDVVAAVGNVFVARAERRRVRGKAHDATIRQIREHDGELRVYERCDVSDLKLADLERIKDPERNKGLIDNLRAWIEDGKPGDRAPLSPKGDPVSKVRLKSKAKVNVLLYRGGPDNPPGTVDRGEMARVDIFRKANKSGAWQYFLVPIYPHEVATMDKPPSAAVSPDKPEDEWPRVDKSYEFLWSLTQMSYLEITTSKGEIIQGYYRGMDRSVGAIKLSIHHDSTDMKRGIGAKTLLSFKKFAVDRLGERSEIVRETRTWRGKACT